VLLHQALDRVGQLEQAQQVGDRRARAPDRFRRLLVGELEFLEQPLERRGFLERAQVLALDVLDQRDRERGVVVHVAHDARHLGEARELGRAPAALAGDDLVAPASDRAHADRLDQALRADRVGKLLQALRVHPGARLVAARLDVADRDLPELGALIAAEGGRRFVVHAQQHFQAAAQSLLFRCHV
jgi:hypothetical protein